MKRARLDDAGRDTVAKEAIAEAKAVLEDLEALYGSMPEESLWDTSMIQTLVQPTACFDEESSKEYRYIGRVRTKDLLAKMLSLQPPRGLQIEGAKGSGKSTAVCSVSGYMLGKKLRKLVYICAGPFILDPVQVLRHALLVATDCDETLAHLTDLDQLDTWCSAHRRDRLLFVVDDWDQFEEFKDKQQALQKIVSCYHILVKLSSTNSRERRIYLASDKKPPPFNFDGPYNHDELKTWIAQSSLSKAELQALDCLTGGMPWLLWFYEEVKGNRKLFTSRIDDTYTRKLFWKLIGLQTTKEQLGSAVEMVTTGVRGIHLKEPVDLTCFYKDRDRFRLLSPYLRSKADYYIMEQNEALQSALSYSHIQRWAGAVRMDCVIKGRNTARAGWNVEGLIIAVMRYQGKLWNGGLSFRHYRTYEPGGEAALLRMLTTDELCEGVLVGPVAFNEKAVDVVCLMLDSETGTLTIKAVQITISKWKNKRRKGSHKVWQEEVLLRWMSEGWDVEHQFVYVIPEVVGKDDLGPIKEDLVQYVAACHAPTTNIEDEDDEDGSGDMYSGTEVYEGVDLAKVKSQGVLFKKLGDVHQVLAEFDNLLNFGPPEQLEKMAVKRCVGVVGTRPCKKWCRTDKEVWYCCEAHCSQASSSSLGIPVKWLLCTINQRAQ